tara:strand:+ start:56 stop:1204 length:1149 start_codon:yes stop_codon:yes gene_type:complete
MANSKLLKEAIADAKAVRETAIANAKIALEEAFTPRLQSILSKKLQAEMEGDDEIEDELDSSDIGSGDEESPVEPSDAASEAHTELGPESEEDSSEVGEEGEDEPVSESEEEEGEESDEVEETMESEEDEVEETYHEEGVEDSEESEEDELDLEAIIKELEMGMEDEEEISEEEVESEEEVSEEEVEDEIEEGESEEESEIEEVEAEEEVEETHSEEDAIEEEDEDDDIDLDEILKEMGYGDDEEIEEVNEEEEEDKTAELEAELEEAYSTVKSLQSTINEVNLLNAKLLYANRLFRGYNLTNEQKTKVVENLDRTTSVREVKLVFATLAESMNFTGTQKKTKKVVSEGASKPVASTAPVKDIISENTNTLAERFKQLANIK